MRANCFIFISSIPPAVNHHSNAHTEYHRINYCCSTCTLQTVTKSQIDIQSERVFISRARKCRIHIIKPDQRDSQFLCMAASFACISIIIIMHNIAHSYYVQMMTAKKIHLIMNWPMTHHTYSYPSLLK